jgi:hypothetical protein
VITNCLLARNVASAWGGAGICGTALVYCCTIVDNEAPYSSGAGVAGPAVVRSCILWGNEPSQVSTSVDIADSDVQGGVPGTENLNMEPLFVDPVAGDYHLQAGSPCIDAGDPSYWEPGAVDLDGQVRLWDGDGDGIIRVDMGMDEFGSFAPGDLNCDGTVDFRDINPFVQYLSNNDQWLAAYPGCAPLVGDINGDGFYGQWSFDDINPFVALLVGG